MMKKIWTIYLLYLISALNMTTSHAQDIFNGTIIRKDQKLYLKRCSVGADEYLIQSKKVEVIKHIEYLNQNYPQFWLSLLATAEYNHSQLQLNVEDIADVHLNQSCDLNQTLEDLFSTDPDTSQQE